MVVLKHILIALCLLLLISPPARAAHCPLSDYKFSGCIQGEVSGAGTSPEIRALMKRLEFRLSTVLPWQGWLLTAEAGMTELHIVLGETCLEYRPGDVTTFKIGRFRPPFGLEPQTLPSEKDTIAGSLLYRFGNYGWPETLGLAGVGEFDYGLRTDFFWPPRFAGLAPFISVALVFGNGRDVIPDIPAQGMIRLGFASRLELEELRHEMELGLSGSYGWNKLTHKSGEYIPLWMTGDLANRESAVSITNFGGHGPVSLLGADISLRMNDLILKAEWMERRIENFYSHGYYLTAIFELEHHIPANLDLVARWEEAVQGYADCLHDPGKPYSAATAGLKWRFCSYWQVEINYVVLLYASRLHAFHNSDIVTAQVQISF